jgi:hypothetical protein
VKAAARTITQFAFDQIPAAHEALQRHHLGKLAIAIG